MDAIQLLEEWVHKEKGRYVHSINIDTDYGANCWEVILGNVGKISEDGWFVRENKPSGKPRAEVFVTETTFLEILEKPPNVDVVVDGDKMKEFPGLEKTILKAIEVAERLGL